MGKIKGCCEKEEGGNQMAVKMILKVLKTVLKAMWIIFQILIAPVVVPYMLLRSYLKPEEYCPKCGCKLQIDGDGSYVSVGRVETFYEPERFVAKCPNCGVVREWKNPYAS